MINTPLVQMHEISKERLADYQHPDHFRARLEHLDILRHPPEHSHQYQSLRERMAEFIGSSVIPSINTKREQYRQSREAIGRLAMLATVGAILATSVAMQSRYGIRHSITESIRHLRNRRKAKTKGRDDAAAAAEEPVVATPTPPPEPTYTETAVEDTTYLERRNRRRKLIAAGALGVLAVGTIGYLLYKGVIDDNNIDTTGDGDVDVPDSEPSPTPAPEPTAEPPSPDESPSPAPTPSPDSDSDHEPGTGGYSDDPDENHDNDKNRDCGLNDRHGAADRQHGQAKEMRWEPRDFHVEPGSGIIREIDQMANRMGDGISAQDATDIYSSARNRFGPDLIRIEGHPGRDYYFAGSDVRISSPGEGHFTTERIENFIRRRIKIAS